MDITIIGTGYVGLVSGACFADMGYKVTCLDIDRERIELLERGEIPFFEPGLSEIVIRNVSNGNLSFCCDYETACRNDIFFICVGTPDDGFGKPNLSFLYSCLNSLKENIKERSFIFTKSTVPLGTNRYIDDYFKDLKKDIRVASNPEFLKEGDAVKDFFKPDRIVIGYEHEEVKEISEDIYKPFNRKKNLMLHMSLDSAELTKYAANSFLATKISFINEIAQLCEHTGANIHDIRSGIGTDARIGKEFLYAGLGYGGSCFPKDINAIIDFQKESKIPEGVLSSAKKINDSQLDFFIQKIKDHFGKTLKEKTLTIWGLSFKPNTDDVRESVAIKLVERLSSLTDRLKLYDPVANKNAKTELRSLTNIEFLEEKYQTIEESHGLIVCTEWKEFWEPDFKELSRMKNKVIFDGRNVLNGSKAIDSGIEYKGIGVTF